MPIEFGRFYGILWTLTIKIKEKKMPGRN
nr:unnamed protein product [Callosobruchus chinensis]